MKLSFFKYKRKKEPFLKALGLTRKKVLRLIGEHYKTHYCLPIIIDVKKGTILFDYQQINYPSTRGMLVKAGLFKPQDTYTYCDFKIGVIYLSRPYIQKRSSCQQHVESLN